MKEKRELTWAEKHPNGDLSHHTFIEGFDDLCTLNEQEVKVALRTLKSHLQKELGFKMTDSLFVDIFKKIPYLAPARPICGLSILHGFILPLRDILKAHNVLDQNWKENVRIIMKFFHAGGRAYDIRSSLGSNQ